MNMCFASSPSSDSENASSSTPTDLSGLDPIQLELQARRLLASAANFLSAAAFLVREPIDDDELPRLLDRVAMLVHEASTIIALVKRSREG